jgi:hypothetical protein
MYYKITFLGVNAGNIHIGTKQLKFTLKKTHNITEIKPFTTKNKPE